jgi:steroid delta-isomerase-like uncharacterized protein
MSRDDNKALVRLTADEVWSKGNLSIVDEIYAPHFLCHSIAGPEWRGREGIRQQVTNHRVAFPDWHEQIEDIIAEGDRVAIRFTSQGTHKGEFQGMLPTGRRVNISEVAIYRIADGKIVEQWLFPDIARLQRQLSGG